MLRPAALASTCAVFALVLAGCAASASPQSGVPSGGSGSTTASPSPAASPSCPNPEGRTCLGPLQAGTYSTTTFAPTITYTVPAGWANYEDDPGNFLLVPPGGTLPGVNQGTSDYIGIYAGASAEKQECIADASIYPSAAATTITAMVAFWRRLPNLTVTAAQDVTVGGLHGVVVDLTRKPGTKSSCFPGTANGYTPVLGGVLPAVLDHGFGESQNLHLRIYLLDGVSLYNGRVRVTIAIEIDDVHGGGSLDTYSALVRQIRFNH